MVWNIDKTPLVKDVLSVHDTRSSEVVGRSGGSPAHLETGLRPRQPRDIAVVVVIVVVMVVMVVAVMVVNIIRLQKHNNRQICLPPSATLSTCAVLIFYLLMRELQNFPLDMPCVHMMLQTPAADVPVYVELPRRVRPPVRHWH